MRPAIPGAGRWTTMRSRPAAVGRAVMRTTGMRTAMTTVMRPVLPGAGTMTITMTMMTVLAAVRSPAGSMRTIRQSAGNPAGTTAGMTRTMRSPAVRHAAGRTGMTMTGTTTVTRPVLPGAGTMMTTMTMMTVPAAVRSPAGSMRTIRPSAGNPAGTKNPGADSGSVGRPRTRCRQPVPSGTKNRPAAVGTSMRSRPARRSRSAAASRTMI